MAADWPEFFHRPSGTCETKILAFPSNSTAPPKTPSLRLKTKFQGTDPHPLLQRIHASNIVGDIAPCVGPKKLLDYCIAVEGSGAMVGCDEV